METITPEKIKKMPYVELMAFLNEINRPPGGKDSIRMLVQNCFISKDSQVLDVGCNTGYCSFEVARLAKCRVTGIDISSEMVESAKKIRNTDPLGYLIDFRIADGEKLPFQDNTFDVVFSGGSTVFIDNKERAIKEYKRVTKPWGFVADINFYYKKSPPKNLIDSLNSLMGIKIQQWNENYWLDLYRKCGLERYFVYKDNVKTATDHMIEKYCLTMADTTTLPAEARLVLHKRLISIMKLFNKNNKHLDYGIFIYRKRPIEEQISLFDA